MGFNSTTLKSSNQKKLLKLKYCRLKILLPLQFVQLLRLQLRYIVKDRLMRSPHLGFILLHFQSIQEIIWTYHLNWSITPGLTESEFDSNTGDNIEPKPCYPWDFQKQQFVSLRYGCIMTVYRFSWLGLGFCSAPNGSSTVYGLLPCSEISQWLSAHRTTVQHYAFVQRDFRPPSHLQYAYRITNEDSQFRHILNKKAYYSTFTALIYLYARIWMYSKLQKQ